MTAIKLSICIATLNRGAFIGATLESIIAQATDEVEIVIVDGASSDNTAEIIKDCQKRFSRLRYFRQNANQGVDRDFCSAVDLASGEYCWLFSDDDLLKPGAIQTVCDALRDPYGLLIANAEVRTSDLSEMLEPRRLPLTTNRIYKPVDHDSLLADTGQYLTFIGCVIIKKSLWQAREKERYFDSFFIHVGVIFQRDLPEDTLIIAEPLIAIRYGNAMWLEKYFEIWMFKWPELIWSFESCQHWAKQKVTAREPWRKVRTLLLDRARGAYSMKLYRRWLEPRLDTVWLRTAAQLAAQFPGSIANLLACFYYSAIVRRSDRRLVLLDLKASKFYAGFFSRRRGPGPENARHSTVSAESIQ